MIDATSRSSPPLEITCSRHFVTWLQEQHLSLAFTTYQTNRLFFVGLKPGGVLSVFERLFDRPMGLYVASRDRLYMSSRFQLWRFENILEPGETHKGYDALYVPRASYTTGDLDVHDLALDGEGKPVFANTLYSCLAGLSDRHSFRPLWQPPFISKLAPEDRCHLNGLALREGRPAYVTTVSRSDVAAGWRQRREQGGCLIDVAANAIVLDNLSMPHSPRWYRDRLWLLNSGTGDFGYFDPQRATFVPVAFCPGYLRGLAFWDNWAIIGLSKPRQERTFSGLELDRRLSQKDADARCGFALVNLTTGNIDHWFLLEGVISELYDVQVIPAVTRSMALGFRNEDILSLVTVEPATGATPVVAQTAPNSSDLVREAVEAGAIFPGFTVEGFP